MIGRGIRVVDMRCSGDGYLDFVRSQFSWEVAVTENNGGRHRLEFKIDRRVMFAEGRPLSLDAVLDVIGVDVVPG